MNFKMIIQENMSYLIMHIWKMRIWKTQIPRRAQLKITRNKVQNILRGSSRATAIPLHRPWSLMSLKFSTYKKWRYKIEIIKVRVENQKINKYFKINHVWLEVNNLWPARASKARIPILTRMLLNWEIWEILLTHQIVWSHKIPGFVFSRIRNALIIKLRIQVKQNLASFKVQVSKTKLYWPRMKRNLKRHYLRLYMVQVYNKNLVG